MLFLPDPGQWAVTPVVPRDTMVASASTAQDQQLSLCAENSPLRIVYGQVTIGPQIAYVLPYNGGSVHFAVWCQGEIDSINNLQLNDEACTLTATHYSGAAGQGIDPTLVAAFAAQSPPITYTDTLPGIAYSVVVVGAKDSAGFPRLTASIKGKKVWNGTATAWSDNPAYCLSDFINSPIYGQGVATDWSSVASVAADCDYMVGGVEKRRTLNLCLDTVQPVKSWVDTLRNYAACWVVPSPTGQKLVSDKAGTSVASYSHTAGNIVDIKSIKKRGVQSMPTVMIVTYRDISTNPARDGTATVYAPGVLAGTTPRRESKVPMPGINRYSQAMREATERLNKLLLNDLSFTLSALDEALAVDVGDIIDVTHPFYGFSAKPMRVMGVSGSYGCFDLPLSEYDSAGYDNSIATAPTYADTTLPNPITTTVTQPAGLASTEEVYQTKDGAIASRLRSTWTAVTDPWDIRYLVTVTRCTSSGGAGAVIVSTDTTIDPLHVHGPLEDGYWYIITVTAQRATFGKKSTAVTLNVQALGKLLKPANVSGFSGSATSTGLRLSWAAVTDIDLKGYAVQEGGSWSVGAAPLVTTAQNITSVNLGYVSVGSHSYKVKAIDWSGGESVAAASASVTITAPSQPSPSAAVSGADVLLSWPAVSGSYPVATYEVRLGSGAGTLLQTTPALSTKIKVPIGTGSQNYYVCAVDVANNSGTSGMATLNVSPPLQPTATIEVIDNNVLLRWSDATATLPIDHYEVRKGASLPGTLIGTLQARFSAIFESAAGVYTYWIIGVDSANNAGAARQVSATVAQPPDFQLLYDQNSAFGGTKDNCVFQDGVLTAPFEESESFQGHFTSRGWTTPQDQINAGYPIYIEPGLTSGAYEEVVDYGTTIASTMLTLSIDYAVVVGTVTLTPSISVSNTSSTGPWTDFAGMAQAFATNFRWIKFRYDFAAAGGANLIQISRINLRMSLKLRDGAGSDSVAVAASGKVVSIASYAFVDVQSIQVTPNATSNITAIYDFVDAPNPTQFTVYLYDAAGNRTTGNFSWSVKGV